MPRIAATSRERLAVAGEAVVSVAPLALEGGVTSDAVTLFVERAGTARPGFGIFDEHDRGGGGRDLRDARRSTPGHRAGRGADGRDERGRGAGPARRPVPAADRPGARPDRQSTLRSTVAWSFDLLDEAERAVLRTASVFAGGFDLPALCAVAEASDDVETLRLLDSLVRKSLVVAHHGAARTRYSMFETIRTFADERLSAGREALRDRHAAHFASEAALRWERWNGPGWHDEVDWVRVELANLRSAFRWSVEPRPGRGGDRCRRPRSPDGLLGRAVRDDRVGRGVAGGRGACRRTAAASAVRRSGVCLLRRAGRGRDRQRPSRRRAGGATGLRVLRARLRDVHRGPRTGLLRKSRPLCRADP